MMNKEKFMIHAEAHSDDYIAEVKFDAVQWFQNASDQEIVNLIKCDFGGDYAADDVVRYFIEKNTAVSDFFSYFDNKPIMVNGDTVGFECHVDIEDAEEWILVNRPQLTHFIHSNKHDLHP